MEPNTPQTPPPQNPNPAPAPEPQKSSIGPTVGIILVIFVLVLGGLYFWGAELAREEADMENPEVGTDSVTAELEAQSNSDELDAIERDLQDSNYDDIDQDAAAFEALY